MGRAPQVDAPAAVAGDVVVGDVRAPDAEEADPVLRFPRADAGDRHVLRVLHVDAAAILLEGVRAEDVEPVGLVVLLRRVQEMLSPRAGDVNVADPVPATALQADAVAIA